MSANPPDLVWRWIVANVIALLAVGAAGLCGYEARKLLAADSADATLAARAMYVAIETALTVAVFVVYATLSGAVLRLIVPALPQRSWLAIHLALGLVNGVGLGLMEVEPMRKAMDWSDSGLLAFLIGPAVAGAFFGAVVGAAQALILRRVAEGMRVWIVISSAAGGAMVLITYAAFLFLPSDDSFAREAIGNVAIAVAGLVAAFLMLPAVLRLRPRTA